MAAVHGDWRSLHWGNRKCKPKMGTIHNSYKSFLLVKAPVSPEKHQLISYLPVYNVTEQPQPLLNAVDGLSHSTTLKPVVVFVLPLCEQAAALARAAPLPLRAQGGWQGTWTREKSQKVQNLPTVYGLCTTMVLVDSNDEVQSAVVLLFMAVCQP